MAQGFLGSYPGTSRQFSWKTVDQIWHLILIIFVIPMQLSARRADKPKKRATTKKKTIRQKQPGLSKKTKPEGGKRQGRVAKKNRADKTQDRAEQKTPPDSRAP